MAKRKVPRQEETQELPPVTVETVLERPLKTTETVEIVPSAETIGLTLPPDSELTHIYNEDTQEMRQVVARAGYAPAPMPFGFRLVTAEEAAALRKREGK
jgi:hypothetical protein